jgi:hypothetical protein
MPVVSKSSMDTHTSTHTPVIIIHDVLSRSSTKYTKVHTLSKQHLKFYEKSEAGLNFCCKLFLKNYFLGQVPWLTGGRHQKDFSLRAFWTKSSQDPISANGRVWQCIPIYPATRGGTNRSTAVQADQTNKVRPCFKNNQHRKGLGGLVQVVEHTPSKCKALSSIPNTASPQKKIIFSKDCIPAF